MRRCVLPQWALVVTALLAATPASRAEAQEAPVVVYLVRHAERAENGTDDPPISDAGHARARLIGTMLRDAGVTALHSTDYLRTRQTAAPLADVLSMEVRSYNPRDLGGFAGVLRNTPGRHVVFGHSNTTPALVEALGGAPGPDILEGEYDRMYVLVIPSDGEVTTLVLRFGGTSVP